MSFLKASAAYIIVVREYTVEEARNYLRSNYIDATSSSIEEAIRNVLDNSPKDNITILLEQHRADAMITCEETCFCWDMEKYLIFLEMQENEKRECIQNA